MARLLAAGFGGTDTSFLAEADEFGNGDDPEFLHYATAVDLDRFLGSARRGLSRLLRVAGYDVRDFASTNEFLDALNPGVSGCHIGSL